MVLNSDSSEHFAPKAIRYLLLAYCFFVPFIRLFFFPVVSAKVQPTEIIFLVLFPLAVYFYGRKLIPTSPMLLGAAGLFLLSNLMSAFSAGELNPVLEALGRGYLLTLAILVAHYIKCSNDRDHRAEQLVVAWSVGAILMAVITAIGYVAAMNGILNRTVVVYENYPYFGTVLRAAGLTGGANSLVYVCLLPMLYFYRRVRLGEKGVVWLLLLFSVCLATISKELVLVFLGFFLVDPWVLAKVKVLRLLAVIFTALVLWFGTHFIVQQPTEITDNYLEGTFYTSEKILWQNDNLQLLETSYSALKKAGISVGAKHPVFGVGPGQFNSYLPKEKELGNYPAHLPEYDPHSTWIGAFSETGLFGLLSLIFLTLILYRFTASKISSERWAANTYLLPVGVSILVVLIASVSLDIVNFRFLWVPIGVLLGLTASEQNPCAA